MPLIFKITPRGDWQLAEAAGVYRGAAIDRADGFIHFSAADQVEETRARHFARQNDLVVVAVEADRLGEALRWEPSRGGALFPHLYGELPLDAVAWVQPIVGDTLPDLGED